MSLKSLSSPRALPRSGRPVAAVLAATAAAALLGGAAAGPAAARAVDPALPMPVTALPVSPLPVTALPVSPLPAASSTVPPVSSGPPVSAASAASAALAQVAAVLPHTHCVLTLHGTDAPVARCGAAAETRAARTGTLLMTWYTGPGYAGGSTDVRSADGPCDAGGAAVFDIGGSLGGSWDHAISSFRDRGGCAVVQGWSGPGYEGQTRTWVGDQPYLGADWDDAIASLVVHG
ncbi:hypothetical protein SAMN05216223_1017 [Actinacidiphila yanglinensis]|uniref:Uncharacterized protein n=1 Tax=Actinacidiphila yanglinensis TaxID=310779 RepID=A0A1H5S5B8_9ACTN|nr:hypothetical protein [Actinacidiphila yanglinensis]SEF45795.1 hypothetical protein SAMN05216223_1017 [Actinacidiphila yanglinensis]